MFTINTENKNIKICSGKLQQSGPTPLKETKRESSAHSHSSSSNGIDKKDMQQLQTIKQLLRNPPPVQVIRAFFKKNLGGNKSKLMSNFTWKIVLVILITQFCEI